MEFEVGGSYTRKSIQDQLGVPQDKRGGDWLTGYTKFNDEVFVFCNVGSAGRTGHDYPNHWVGEELVWSAKTRSQVEQPLMKLMASSDARVHVFFREADRAPFEYAGLAKAVDVRPTTPVVFRWSFDAVAPGKIIKPNGYLTSDAVSEQLEQAGFAIERRGVKVWRASRGELVLYVKRDSGRCVLVIGPNFEGTLTRLKTLDGVERRNRAFFYHNSTMRSFPQRLNTGRAPIPYGFDFDFRSVRALKKFLAELEALPIVPGGDDRVLDTMNVDPLTESEGMRAYRLGQQRFRANLLERWNGRCAFTGIAINELLRASHIKSWSVSTPKERLDPYNGLLLVVHIDGLFDQGFISFDRDGKVLVSKELSASDLKCFGLDAEARIVGLSNDHQAYLGYHRELYGYAG